MSTLSQSVPKVAIDLDGVLADYTSAFISTSLAVWGEAPQVTQIGDDWATTWGISAQEARDRSPHVLSEEFYRGMLPIDGSDVGVRTLSEHAELIVVTSRAESTSAATEEWLERFFGGAFAAISYVDPWNRRRGLAARAIGKGNACAELGAAVLIDDQLRHCIDCAKCGIRAVHFSDESRSDHPSVWTCSDWSSLPVLVGRLIAQYSG